MSAETLTAIAATDPAEAATELAERLVRTADSFDMPACHVLIQASTHHDEHDDRLRFLLESRGTSPHRVRLDPLPEKFHPSLVSLRLDRGVDSMINAELAAMAIEDGRLDALREGRTHRVVGWFFTAMEPPVVARRIRESALRYCRLDRRKKWVRFYDPLVADLYWPLLTETQRAGLLSGIHGWAWLDRWNQLAVASSPPAHVNTRNGDHVFSAAQWHACEAIEAVNQAWIRMRSCGAPSDAHRLLAAHHAVVEGRSLGIGASADIELFAWHSLSLGPGFHRRDPFLTLIRDGFAGGQRYARIARAPAFHAERELAGSTSQDRNHDHG